jgi:hypothetical protein
MTMDRRSIIILLIGVIASMVGFGIPAFLRQRRCGSAGGTWDGVGRHCVASTGERIDVSVGSDVVIGALIAIALAFMLFRILLFAMGRMTRRAP